MENIKGIIFDYGGTIDSRGVHWSEIIWDGYQAVRVGVNKEIFRDAYVFAERELARVHHIEPSDNFLQMMRRKIAIELKWLVDNNHLLPGADTAFTEPVARYCYDAALNAIADARPVLEKLAERFPMVLVSNFYGNIDTVLRDFNLRHLFKGVIESSVVGVRKPDPTIFRLGVVALDLPAQQVLVVGDSLKKDILPARSIGCQTAWLKGKGWTEAEDLQTDPAAITSLAQVLDVAL
ncbi:MAG: HAD family hydrolase [Firmicutes bacterium]|nr:HAD family hydrolase [Bacillota bacterium]MCM1400548.1 HAD family hydrolase [Bacteroides sp.]MCM1476452.1 HAD family hydrolase [Bacteroides sp.]